MRTCKYACIGFKNIAYFCKYLQIMIHSPSTFTKKNILYCKYINKISVWFIILYFILFHFIQNISLFKKIFHFEAKQNTFFFLLLFWKQMLNNLYGLYIRSRCWLVKRYTIRFSRISRRCFDLNKWISSIGFFQASKTNKY